MPDVRGISFGCGHPQHHPGRPPATAPCSRFRWPHSPASSTARWLAAVEEVVRWPRSGIRTAHEIGALDGDIVRRRSPPAALQGMRGADARADLAAEGRDRQVGALPARQPCSTTPAGPPRGKHLAADVRARSTCTPTHPGATADPISDPPPARAAAGGPSRSRSSWRPRSTADARPPGASPRRISSSSLPAAARPRPTSA